MSKKEFKLGDKFSFDAVISEINSFNSFLSCMPVHNGSTPQERVHPRKDLFREDVQVIDMNPETALVFGVRPFFGHCGGIL